MATNYEVSSLFVIRELSEYGDNTIRDVWESVEDRALNPQSQTYFVFRWWLKVDRGPPRLRVRTANIIFQIYNYKNVNDGNVSMKNINIWTIDVNISLYNNVREHTKLSGHLFYCITTGYRYVKDADHFSLG